MGTGRHPVIWLIWDAAAAWVTRALLAEGALPALGQLLRCGVFAAAQPPQPNCQTPPGLATLLTGVWPWKHGISGFNVPDLAPDQPITARRTGFDPALLRAEPIWAWAARHGRQSVLVHVPWMLFPPLQEAPPGVCFTVDGYSRRIVRGGVVRFGDLAADAAGRRSLVVGPYQFTLAPEAQGIALSLAERGTVLMLTPQPAGSYQVQWLPIAVGEAIGFQLWQPPDGGELLLLHSGIWQVRTAPAEAQEAFSAATGPFVGEGLGAAYRRGAFGPRLIEGGSGQAEAWLVATIGTMADYFTRSGLVALEHYPTADLYICYQPCIDDIEHELLGYCDPHSPAYCPPIAEAIWEAVRAVYQMADRYLGAMLERVGTDATVILSSDHGMAGMIATVHVNEALRQAGLLAFMPDGTIDLAQTAILFHPANNGSLWVNRLGRPGGWVPPERAPEVVQRAAQVLRALYDPTSGAALIAAIYPLDGTSAVGWDTLLGDLFLSAADGYELSAAASSDGAVLLPTRKSASHVTNPDRPALQGIFAARGPHIRAGIDLGLIDNRDLVPLICHQLGIAPPPNIEGCLREKLLDHALR